MQSDGSGETRLRQDLVSTSSAAWASDGTRIAFNRVGGDISGGGIFVMNADGSGLSEVATPELVGQREPTWSPDNLRIAFSAFPAAACCDFETDIYVMQADGSGLSNLTNHPANDRSPDWSWR
jgi:Tol biopolymer transport system component